MTPSCHDRVQEIEHLANELNHLLSHNGSVLERGGVHTETRGLMSWVDRYRRGLHHGILETDDDTLSNDSAWAAGVSDRLQMEFEAYNSQEEDEPFVLSIDNSPAQPDIEKFIKSAHLVMRIAFHVDQAPDSFRSTILNTMRSEFQLPSMTKEESLMLQTRVKELMKRDPVIIPMEYTLKETAQEMEFVNCGMLPVGTAEEIVGIITDRDIVLRAVAKGKDINKEKVKHYMTPEVCAIHEDDTTDQAASFMREKNINRVLVRDAQNRPCGILTFGRLIREGHSMQELSTVIQCAVGQKAA